MQKIIPFLWFDDNAEEAVDFYVSLFENSKAGNTVNYDKISAEASKMPEGSVMMINFKLAGQEFSALNGGSHFKFTPAISLFVNCETEEEIKEHFKKLSDGGKVLMPLEKYDFSEKFGWVDDKYGLSWQLNLASGVPLGKQKITPFLTFVGDQKGKAEEAMIFYASLFEDSKIEDIARYSEEEIGSEENVKHGFFILSGQEFMAMDSAMEHNFNFSGAISFLVNCADQEEVDHFWENLSADPEAEQCGWLKDKYGVWWQIVPTVLDEMLMNEDKEKAQRTMRAMLKMKKIDIAELERAYEGK